MNPRTRRAMAFWSEQDWTRSNVAIASQTGRNRKTVSIWRKRLAKPPGPATNRQGPKVEQIRLLYPDVTKLPHRVAGIKYGISTSSARLYAKALGDGPRRMGRPRKVLPRVS